MNSDLENRIRSFDDTLLLEQYTHAKHEYTPEAFAIIEDEISKRKLDVTDSAEDEVELERPILSRDDFGPVEGGFLRTDMLLIQAMLKDEDIPFFAQAPEQSVMIPVAEDGPVVYTLFTHPDDAERTLSLLREHFEVADGIWRRTINGTVDRLRSLNFYDFRLTEKEAEETIEITFADKERKEILSYVNRLEVEADEIEQQEERVLFYFDHLDELRGHLSKSGTTMLTKEDLLAILEVLQIYCDKDNFPQELEDIAEGLLGVLLPE